MKSKSVRLAGTAIAAIMLAAVLGISQSRAQSCVDLKKFLTIGQTAIILKKDPIVSGTPDEMLNQILVCSYEGDVKPPCKYCKLSVAECREKSKDFCEGTIDATTNSSLGLTFNWTRTSQSPDTCCKQVCIDGSCKNKCWPC